MRNTALPCATGALLFLATATLPAQAQYVNPYTNNNWNNPNSSLLDTTLLGMRNRMMLDNNLLASRVSSAALTAAYNRQKRLGESRIQSGKATTRFSSGPFPTDYWVTRCGANTPEKRKQYAAEFVVQRDIFAQEARARHADTTDMAQALGLTFVIAWEGQTGQKATDAQYRGIAQDLRTMLLKDPLYQGMSAANRQTYFEGRMIDATEPVRLLHIAQRTGDPAMLQQAHTKGLNYVNTWLPHGYTHYEATPTGFQERR